MQKILIIEDDHAIGESLRLYLENSGFEVYLHGSGLGVPEKIEEFHPNLLILDINLPGKDGITICKELRETSSISIIMLTARNSELDKVTGLEIGADDYIAKPFSPRELLARVNSILRRTDKQKTDAHTTLDFENVVLNLDKKVVFVDKKEVFLTSHEFHLLKKIMEEKGKVVSRETLMREVMGYDRYIYDRTIDTHIKNIRKKLNNSQMIITVRGQGYRLNK